MSKGAEHYPRAVEPTMVGEYSALAKAGGGLVWDAVLEYRVWCRPPEGGDHHYYAFATYEEALECARREVGAEEPLALVLQKEWLDEPEPGVYERKTGERVAEWQVVWLRRPRRTDQTIRDFLSPDAPDNRLDILRGLAS